MPQEPALLQPVLEVWREVLGRERAPLTADSNLFLSGGDSLDLLRILVRMRERFGVELELRDAAQFSTPRRMAVRGVDATVTRCLLPVSQHASQVSPHTERFPCTAGQAALWLAELASGASGLYNTAVVLQLSGQLDVAALACALQGMLVRHEILRVHLKFDVGAQRLFAVVGAAPAVLLDPVAMPAAAARVHLQEAAARPFDLEHGPLWRFQLVAVGARQWSLLLCLHHVVTDGWSGSLLLHDLAAAYDEALHDRSPPAAIDREFRGFCLHQQAITAADWHWWRNYLRGADRLRGWPPTGSAQWPFAMACEERALDRELLNRLHEAIRACGGLPSAFFLSALRLALRAFTGIDELCIGMPVNVRNRSAQENGIGYFVNLVLTRERLPIDMDARAALNAVQHSLSEVLSRPAVPFAELARALRPVPLPSGNPWCDILFAYQNLPAAKPDFTGLHASLEILPPARGQHPLKVEFMHTDGDCVCRIEYAADLLTQAQVCALLAELRYQLSSLAAALA